MAKFPGASAGTGYVFSQGSAASNWLIPHGLNKYPSVVAQDNTNAELEGDIIYVDTNHVELKFSAAVTGKAYLN